MTYDIQYYSRSDQLKLLLKVKESVFARVKNIHMAEMTVKLFESIFNIERIRDQDDLSDEESIEETVSEDDINDKSIEEAAEEAPAA